MKVKQLGFCSIICTLSLLSMFMVGLFPMADYAFPALAGILLCSIVIEYGYRQAVLCYVVVGMLAAILVPHKFSVLLFVLFLGFYPLVKGRLEQMRRRLWEWVLKFVCFNGCMAIGFVVLFFYAEQLSFTWYLLGLVANVVFVVYDRAVTQAIGFYLQKIRPKIHR